MDPWGKNPKIALNPGPFREGDRVRLVWGRTPVEGVIVEDRGNIGRGGRRIYHVLVHLDDNISEPMTLPAAAENLTLVAKAPPQSRKGRRKGSRDER
jgi:hypothetical protein